MNISGIIGLLAGIALVIYGMIGQGDPISGFIDYPSMAITFGGTLGALLMAFPFKVVKNVPKMLKMFFKPKRYKPEEYIEQMVEYAKLHEARAFLLLKIGKRL